MAVIGLPRSGTTLVANVLHACRNGFCLVEPHWEALSRGSQATATAKTGLVALQPPGSIACEVRRVMRERGFDFAAVKETFRRDETACVNGLLSDADAVLFVRRDPVATFASWRRQGWGPRYDDIGSFERNFVDLRSLASRMARHRPTFMISYERLCSDAARHVDAAFAGYASLEGTLAVEPMDVAVAMGDPRARASARLEPASPTDGGLCDDELQRLRRLRWD
ncbi:MAG TPA: hypothetical protein VF796_09315 [Humisphaera sp.]